MSTPDIKAAPQPLPEAESERAFPLRALLIGLGVALLVGVVAVLSLRDAGADAALDVSIAHDIPFIYRVLVR